MKRLLKLRGEYQAALTAMRGMLDKAGDADLTAEQDVEYKALEAKAAQVKASIAREEALVAEEDRIAQAATRAQGRTPVVTDVHVNAEDHRFETLGENLQLIARAGRGQATNEDLARLHGAASGGSAGVGSDGGFAIQTDFAIDLMKDGFAAGALASRCSVTPIGPTSDGLEVVYTDETSRATGSRWGGVRVYRRAEADTVNASKPQVGKWERRLEDLMGIAYMTERLLEDAPAMQSVYEEAFTDEFAFVVDDEIFRGSGAGQCLGVITAPASVTVAKESGQAADTIVFENVNKMWSRVHPRSRSRGAWFINVECDLQLPQMMVGTGTSGQLVYMPPGGISGAQYGSLYGRPVIPIEHASALGDLGDISYLDLEQFKLITKGGLKRAESMHVRFLYDEMTFRWKTRVNGAPKSKAPLTPYKGANTLSSFVFLAAR